MSTAVASKSASRPAHQLVRTTFVTNRALEFFSQKELQLQIGHPPDLWLLALVKELIDNALDACESHDIAPRIRITVTPDSVSVQDNGRGLPEATLNRSLDYLVRVSDKNHYISPSRGQLGNALKCVWATPFVATDERAELIVHANGVRYTVLVTLDRIAQAPRISIDADPDPTVKNGTRILLHWPNAAKQVA